MFGTAMQRARAPYRGTGCAGRIPTSGIERDRVRAGPKPAGCGQRPGQQGHRRKLGERKPRPDSTLQGPVKPIDYISAKLGTTAVRTILLVLRVAPQPLTHAQPRQEGARCP